MTVREWRLKLAWATDRAASWSSVFAAARLQPWILCDGGYGADGKRPHARPGYANFG